MFEYMTVQEAAKSGNCPSGGFRNFVRKTELMVWYILAGFG